MTAIDFEPATGIWTVTRGAEDPNTALTLELLPCGEMNIMRVDTDGSRVGCRVRCTDYETL